MGRESTKKKLCRWLPNSSQYQMWRGFKQLTTGSKESFCIHKYMFLNVEKYIILITTRARSRGEKGLFLRQWEGMLPRNFYWVDCTSWLIHSNINLLNNIFYTSMVICILSLVRLANIWFSAWNKVGINLIING